MRQEHKRHPNSQIGELARTAVRSAGERRVRILSAEELEGATGGVSNLLVDWRINGGKLAERLQAASLGVNVATQVAVQAQQFRVI